METTASGWNIIDRDAGVLSASYVFDGKQATANTFVARMHSGGLAVVSPPVGTSDAMFAELDEFGAVEVIVANNGFHHLGLPPWHARYPKARCFAPTTAIKRIRKKNADAPELEPLSAAQELLGGDIAIIEAEPSATKCGECWAWAKTEAGYVWFASDMLANMETLPPSLIPRLLFKWTGSAPGYRIFHLVMKLTLRDKPAVLRAFASDIAAHPPAVVVPGHGAILQRDDLAAETERLLASSLN